MATTGWQMLAQTARLRLAHTLGNGQCFNWRQVGEPTQPRGASFVGVIARCAVELRERDDVVEFRRLCRGPDDDALGALRQYFQLDEDLEALVSDWSASCERIAAVSRCVPGMCIVQQDPLECLISFICSSNNNIARITMMLDKLRRTFGTETATAAAISSSSSSSSSSSPASTDALYAFPSIEQLSAVSEEQLREMGFGYRAKYLVNTVSKLRAMPQGGDAWLGELRAMDQSAESLEAVRKGLLVLDGVGPKVADCVALFSLDRHGVVPVDTHVWQIAVRDLDPTLAEAKSLTPAVYERVGGLFRQRYGAYAGWAHSLLFAAELPQFQQMLPDKMQAEMKSFAGLEKARKAALKATKAALKATKLGTKAEAENLPLPLPLPDSKKRSVMKTKTTSNKRGKKRKPSAAAAAAAAGAAATTAATSADIAKPRRAKRNKT